MIDAPSRRPALLKRRYIVDQSFQYRLIRTLLSIWLAHSVFFTLVLYFFYEGHLRQFYDLVPRPGLLPLISPSTLFAISIGFVVAFGFVVLLVVAVYMSNQIAGPLYRTKKGLDRVARGEWSFHLQFRQGDFLRDVPAAFNNMLDSLRHQAEMDVEELRAIEALDEDPAEWKRLVRKQRERKEAQLGIGPDAGGTFREPEAVSLTVH
jgi:methyl-accepting chemotaxis protein